MTDQWKWQKLGDITAKITDRLQPVKFEVVLQGSLAVAVFKHSTETGVRAETIISEAVRAYMGDA